MVWRDWIGRLPRRAAALSTVVAAGLLTAMPAEGAVASAGRAQEPMGRYVVILEDWTRDRVDSIVREHRRRYDQVPGHVYRSAVVGYSAQMPQSLVGRLRRDPRVLMVSPDRVVSADQQVLPTGVDRVEADLSSTTAGDGLGSVDADVAVIDTGIDLNHRDLNVVGGVNCIQPGLSPEDDNGHGTHVAGTAAARDNGVDVVGTAPGARLYSVKVLGVSGRGHTSDIVCGLNWVADNAGPLGIDVANMSLGGSGTDDGNCGLTNNDAEHFAICRVVHDAGVPVVVAAGNSSRDFAQSIPAAYDEVLTVTAMGDANGQPGGGGTFSCSRGTDDRYAGYSNFTTVGSPDAAHTIAAPGSCILSTRLVRGPGGRTTITFSGTSMASPHVAGTVALCSTGPCAGLTPAQITDLLRAEAAEQPASYGFIGDPHTPVDNRYYGHLLHTGDF